MSLADRHVTVVTFSTCGAPQDEGLDLRAAAFAMREIVADLGYRFVLYTPARLIAEGQGDLVRAYDEQYRLPMNAGYHASGFGAWKPYIILETMRHLPPGAVVFYLDANMIKYPDYREKLRHIPALLDLTAGIGDFRIFRHAPHGGQQAKHFSSETQLREIGGNSEFCRNFPLLAAHNIVCINSPAAFELTQTWLDLCRDERLLLPPAPGDHDAQYQWFCAEQSVINLLVARRVEEGRLPWHYPGISFGRGFKPEVSEHAHVALLAQSRSPCSPPPLADSAPTFTWQALGDAPQHWFAMHGLRLTQADGAMVIAASAAPDWQILRLLEERLRSRPVRVRVRATPLAGCDTCLIILQINGTVIAAVDAQGAVAINGAATLEVQRAGDDIELSAIFYNLDGSFSLGLGQPQGLFAGNETPQYAIRAVDIEFDAGTES